MKKFVIFVVFILIIFSSFTYTVSAKDSPPPVSADSVVLLDAATGTVLYSKNMNTAYPPASTTKLMTALLTLENCDLNDIVTVGKNPPNAEGSSIYILEGEQLTVSQLLHGLLLQSGNDCALALAEHISGSTEEFVKLMNKRAAELGCKNTNFVNPNGLYNVNHKASALDLALIMRELTKHPDYFTISTRQVYKIPPTNKCPEERIFANENRLIKTSDEYRYAPCDGGKTGYTIQSKHSYVATAVKNGQRLIVALVHDEKKTFFPDAKSLFEYGFNNFELSTLYKKDDIVTSIKLGDKDIPLLASEDFYYVKEKGTNEKPEYSLINKDLSSVSFKNGDVVMEAEVKLENKPIGTLKLSAGKDHIINSLAVASIMDKKNISKLTYVILLAASIVLLLYAVLIRRKKLKKYKYN